MINNSEFIKKLRSSGLRPTTQRIEICNVLFNRNNTFHFTVTELVTLLETRLSKKISLATIYNTIHAFKKKGYLKEVCVNSVKSYFDTNTSNHHHFFNESTNQLIDLKDDELGSIKIKKKLVGKKIQSLELLVKIANNN